MKKQIAFLTALLLALPLNALPAAAAGEKTLEISTAEEFSEFAKNCTLDSYSRNLTVTLTADIDLSQAETVQVPIFCGTFDGGGYTVSGLTLDGDGSEQGLFRYVTEGASVSHLTVNGTVTPGGSGCEVGGIAGENSGTLYDCTFNGTVTGNEQVGGITGENTLTGVIADCTVCGTVTGQKEAGGIVGENDGTVLSCSNFSDVSACALSGSEDSTSMDLTGLASDLSDFDIASVTEEDFVKVTDIGGVAGLSTGTVGSCTNEGSVGYPRQGYNVGGITGRSSGYLNKNVNRGEVQGRRDVGGITGQLTPYTAWDYSESKLTELEAQLEELDTLVAAAVSDAEGVSSQLGASFNGLISAANSAGSELKSVAADIAVNTGTVVSAINDAITVVGGDTVDTVESVHDDVQDAWEKITGETAEETEAPSESAPAETESVQEKLTDKVSEVQEWKQDRIDTGEDLLQSLKDTKTQVENNTPDVSGLLSALSGLSAQASSLSGSLGGTASALESDLKAVSAQADALMQVLTDTAEEVTEVTLDARTDISVEKAGDYTQSLAENNMNYGGVSAEYNAGGIAGNMDFEVEFDAEDQLNVSDYVSSDAKYLIYSVIQNCENYGDVTAKSEAAGGIVGTQQYGAVLSCVGVGTISVTEGNYAGGIAGASDSWIQDCFSRTNLTASAYAGGIAGTAANLSGCISYSFVDSAGECAGAVAGEVTGEAADNLYVEGDLGGIDGVSYAGIAEPVSYDTLKTRTDIPESFKDITVTFTVDGEVFEEVSVPFGGSIDELPEVPAQDGKTWQWDSFDSDAVYYSMTVSGQWVSPVTVISTGEDVPLLLAEGTFREGQLLSAAPVTPDYDALGVPEDRVLCAYTVTVPDCDEPVTLHLHCEEAGAVYALQEDGSWTGLDAQRDGAYLIFTGENGGTYAVVGRTKVSPVVLIACGAGAAVIAAGTAFLLYRKKHKK